MSFQSDITVSVSVGLIAVGKGVGPSVGLVVGLGV